MRLRIMYLEVEGDGLTGPARIGRVSFSRSAATLYSRGRSSRSLKGFASKGNAHDVETGGRLRIAGPRHDGADRRSGERLPTRIDAAVRHEHRSTTRGRRTASPESSASTERPA